MQTREKTPNGGKKRNRTFLLKGFLKWQDFQEHLPAGRQGTRSNCIIAGDGLGADCQRGDVPGVLGCSGGFDDFGQVSAYTTAKNTAIAAVAAAEQKTADKDDAMENLTDVMKSDIRYAENTVDFDDDKLKLIGWAGRAAGTPLAIPGQVRSLEAPRQGEGEPSDTEMVVL